MRIIGFIFAFALIIPMLLPDREQGPAPVAMAVAQPEVQNTQMTKIQDIVPKTNMLERAKAPAFPFAADLASLVGALTTVGAEVDSPEGHCLAQAVYFEARSEPLSGQLAVAQVILNRVKDSHYPETICGVVFQNEHSKHRCQFSFACDGLSDNPYEMEPWETARRIAYIALSGRWKDITLSATHYHAVYVKPRWANNLVETGQFGSHIFYRFDDAAS